VKIHEDINLKGSRQRNQRDTQAKRELDATLLDHVADDQCEGECD